MVYCVALNCTTRSGQGIGLFEFPKDDARRKAWILKVRRKDFVPSSTARLCAKHFTNDQYVINPVFAMSIGYKPKKLVLKPDAEPTLFNYSNRKQLGTQGKDTKLTRVIEQSGAVAKRRRIEKIDTPILRKSTCSIMGKDQTGDKMETDNAELHKSDENMELKSNSMDTEMRSMQYAIYTLQPSQTGDAYSENHKSRTSSYNTVNVKSEPMTQDHCDLESTENENKMMKSQPYPIKIFTNNYKHHENTIIQLQSPELLTENVIKSEPHSPGEISRENLKIENSIIKQEPDCTKTFSSTTIGNEYMTVNQESNSTQEYEHENITIKEEPEDEYPDETSNTEFTGMSIKTEPETDERSNTEFMSIKTEPKTDERSNTEFMSIKTEPETDDEYSEIFSKNIPENIQNESDNIENDQNIKSNKISICQDGSNMFLRCDNQDTMSLRSDNQDNMSLRCDNQDNMSLRCDKQDNMSLRCDNQNNMVDQSISSTETKTACYKKAKNNLRDKIQITTVGNDAHSNQSKAQNNSIQTVKNKDQKNSAKNMTEQNSVKSSVHKNSKWSNAQKDNTSHEKNGVIEQMLEINEKDRPKHGQGKNSPDKMKNVGFLEGNNFEYSLDDNSYSCLICRKKFSTYKLHVLVKHIREEHFVYKCSVCKCSFYEIQKLTEHSKTCFYISGKGQASQSQIKQWADVNIKDRLENVERIKKRKESEAADQTVLVYFPPGVKPVEKFVGRISQDIPKPSVAQVKFIEGVHFHARMDSSFVCLMCNETLENKFMFDCHARTVHFPYSCAVCPAFFKTKDELSNHIRYCVYIMGEGYQCTLCTKTFRTSSLLEQHRRKECMLVLQ